jgi:NAD+ kinase
MTEIPRNIKRALLFINRKKRGAEELAGEISRDLGNRGIAADSLAYEGKPDFSAGESYDIAFSLGGDGTVLYAARTMAPLGVPVFPINLGTLGFIAEVDPRNWREEFNRWVEGTGGFSRRFMLEVRLERKGGEVFREFCLNDVVISASGIAKIIRLEVNSAYMKLGRYRSDGLIAATPTGSTAYSMAAGGPILDPELEALIINPICPFTLSHRPMVLPAREPVVIGVEEEQRSGVLLTVDGQVTETLEEGDLVRLGKAPFGVHLIASERAGFYRALRTKLSWSGGPGHA